MKKSLIPFVLSAAMLMASCGGGTKPVASSSSVSSADSSASQATSEESSEVVSSAEESSAEESSEVVSSEESSEPVIDPAVVLGNLFDQIAAFNWVVDDPTYVKNIVPNEYEMDRILLDGDAVAYFATDEEEVFFGEIGETALENIEFVGDGYFTDYAWSLADWMYAANSKKAAFVELFEEGDEDLVFTTTDSTIIKSSIVLSGWRSDAAPYFTEVTITLDDEDASGMTIEVAADPDYVSYGYSDVYMTCTFGDAEGATQVADWLANPVYPEKTAWTEDEVSILDYVYGEGLGEAAFPFPTGSSYKAQLITDYYSDYGLLALMDGKAAAGADEAYIAQLIEAGFVAVDGADGVTYDKLLDEETYATSYLMVEYEAGYGLMVMAGLYYNLPKTEGLDAVNTALAAYEVPALAASDLLTGWALQDATAYYEEQTGYDFDYVYSVTASFEAASAEGVAAYLAAYGETLVAAGFAAQTDEETGEIMGYRRADDGAIFQYEVDATGTLNLLYYREHQITAAEVNVILAEKGFPGIPEVESSLTFGDYTALFGDIYDGILSLNFATAETANNYVASYGEILVAAGFELEPAEEGSSFITYIKGDLKVEMAVSIPEEGDTESTPYIMIFFTIMAPAVALEEVNGKLTEFGIPTIDFGESVVLVDIDDNTESVAEYGYDYFCYVECTFDTIAETEAWMTSYAEALVDAGFTYDETYDRYVNGNMSAEFMYYPDDDPTNVTVCYIVRTPEVE
ncbi:MAG: hypothetical protein K5694_06810 [Bacilli bacterium]|nr:hypothetical protein [Bacilli bacterium]